MPGRLDRYVLALGTVEPRKDLPGLVTALDAVAATVTGVRLVVAGPDGWGTPAYEAAVAAAAHRDRVVRLGYVGDRDRADLLAGATLFAYPSIYEGFGFPPLEAMTCGTAVVATRAGAVPEVCGDAAALVDVGDVDGLAEVMGSLLGDDTARAALVAAGREHVLRFSWETCAREMAAVYGALCPRTSR
ncbi:MAG: glycosyltransferase family 1 protein [Acidimicrobiia bacterium]